MTITRSHARTDAYLCLCELQSNLRTLARRNRHHQNRPFKTTQYRETVCEFGELLVQVREDGLETRLIAQATSGLPSEVRTDLANMGIAV